MMLEPSSPPSSSSLSKPSDGLQEPLKNNSALCWLRPETVRGTASRSSVAEETELDVEEEKTKREEECVCVCECGQLSGLLQEVREEVQREHSRKLEQLSQEHQEQLLTLRHEHLEEESVERERLLRAHLEERERMQDSHTSQLEQLRLQLDSQLQHTHKTHMQKRARQFLEKETSCLRARQAALRTAHPSPQRSAAGGSAQPLCQVRQVYASVMQCRDLLQISFNLNRTTCIKTALILGVSMDTSARYPMRATRAYSGYTPARPLFTRYPAAPPTNGLVQLGLDENNQIKVYHYRRGTTH
ncbi:uncharacterized protein LOC143485498 [Brachyhypopomus gauderio]|uniref:uncharacterized protein LOC143485498 n=1 Tax=Brachyhypopomus gauderio TaxID=698409 RepID=UPI004042E92A